MLKRMRGVSWGVAADYLLLTAHRPDQLADPVELSARAGSA
jgi:hypothetical protein